MTFFDIVLAVFIAQLILSIIGFIAGWLFGRFYIAPAIQSHINSDTHSHLNSSS